MAAAVVREIETLGVKALAVQADVSKAAEAEQLVEQALTAFGQIDLLINNAGITRDTLLIRMKEEDWDDVLQINLKGAFLMTKLVGKAMLKKKSGRIVNISSQASVVAIKGEAVYCASKAGINMLTKVLAAEWSGRGVTINAVGPTFVRTPGTAERLDDPEFLAGVMGMLPRGRVATIDDVAGAVIYLASDAADMVTGTLLLVDGGWTAL